MENFIKIPLFSYKGIKIYKENVNDEDGFVSFLGCHSIATKGDNAVVTMEELEEFIEILKWSDEMDYKFAPYFILACICHFLKKDNVDASFCQRETYLAFTEKEKEDWYGIGDNANPEFYIRIKCEEW